MVLRAMAILTIRDGGEGGKMAPPSAAYSTRCRLQRAGPGSSHGSEDAGGHIGYPAASGNSMPAAEASVGQRIDGRFGPRHVENGRRGS